jgi:hypothetical protein
MSRSLDRRASATTDTIDWAAISDTVHTGHTRRGRAILGGATTAVRGECQSQTAEVLRIEPRGPTTLMRQAGSLGSLGNVARFEELQTSGGDQLDRLWCLVHEDLRRRVRDDGLSQVG